MNEANSLCNCLPANGNQVREISELVWLMGLLDHIT